MGSSRASRCLPVPGHVSAPRSKHNGASRIYFAIKVVGRGPPISVTAAEAPKHKAHALKALKQRKPAHAAKLGMVAEHPRQAVERNAAA
jgi:hypothetical protein